MALAEIVQFLEALGVIQYGSSTFDVEFNPFDCMADYGLFQNLHKEVTACECQ